VNLRPGYRVRQFWGALGCSAKPVEEAVLRAHLNTAQIALFRRMSIAEQAHAVAVLDTLQERGCKLSAPSGGSREFDWTSKSVAGLEQILRIEPALAQAALLHDVGKIGGRTRLWHRVATVLLQALCLGLLRRLALNEPHSWRYPFFVQLHHAERGADLSAEVGTDVVAVALIRAHHTAPEQSGLDAPRQVLLSVLRWADEQS
jgi:hypothetical protein